MRPVGMDADVTDSTYGRAVGDRLRHIRRQKRLSLQEVEAISDQEFKASVLGAYERGERAISVPRLARLAKFYRVPVDQLLPGSDNGSEEDPSVRRDVADGGTRIDLTRLEQLNDAESQMLSRYVRMIQVQRQDFNGRVLTIRRDDMRAIACILGVNEEVADGRLGELGLRLDAVPNPATTTI
ncbi:MAG: transcriptional regulator [Microthrixaceae bacterium]